MSVGGFFLLLIALVVVAILGWWLYVLIMWLRSKQLDRAGNKLEQPPEEPPRPDHVEVDGEQRTRFVGSGR